MRPPPPLEPLLPLAVALGDGAHAEAHERLDVARQLAVAGDDRGSRASSSAKRASTLTIARVVRVRGAAAARSRSSRLSTPGHVERDRLELVAARELDAPARRSARVPPPPLAICAAVSAARCIASQVELLDVGVAGGVALLHAHAEAQRDAARRALEDARRRST